MTRCFTTVALLAFAAGAWAAAPPDAETLARFGKSQEAIRLNIQGTALYRAGRWFEATKVFAEVLRLHEGLYPKARFPQGHWVLANSINWLTVLHEAQGEYTKAVPLSRRALEMYEGLYPKVRYPQGHPQLATSINNLAVLHQAQGEYAKASPLFHRALQMREGLYPKERFPQGHPDLAVSINNLAQIKSFQGEYAKAEPLLRRALQMYEELYPKARYPQGHPQLATSINNLAGLHYSREEYAKAELLYRRTLQMYEGLYPKKDHPQGHTSLAHSINNLAFLHKAQEKYAKAAPLFCRALEMRERLFDMAHYPQGHPDLARSINNLAILYKEQGEYAKAAPLFCRALEMRERLFSKARYPQGHPYLARTINNLAGLHLAQGESSKAEPLFHRALQMYGASAAALAASAPEATSLNYLASLPLTRDAYLSVTRPPHKADAYLAVWQSKAALSRLYERRHLAVLAASSQEARSLWDGVLGLRRERERLLLAPADRAKAKARDQRLDAIDEEIRKKEADLRPLLPALKRSDELAKATPDDLRKALPAGAVLVDLLRYVHYEQDLKTPGKKGEKRTPRYVGFVVSKDNVARVELGSAAPTEEAVKLWRQAISETKAGQADAGQRYAEELHRLVWRPLQEKLPSGTTTIYLSPDMVLTRLPWAALPGKMKGGVLLEDYDLVVVPHGPFLLDWLTREPEKAAGKATLLALGAVRYDHKPAVSVQMAAGLRGAAPHQKLWNYLAGTQTELKRLQTLAEGLPLRSWQGEDASVQRLLSELPQARYAHLATHGFFADRSFRSVLQLDEKLFARHEFRLGGVQFTQERIGAGSRSPLVLSGPVCAGANLPETEQRGILSADAIVSLDLRKLHLAVLSACESGLGDVAGGEGVFGLQRAFHIAGARNVAASLWKVDDEATAALMTQFYLNLWHSPKKMTPREALRRAQLALYRNPQSIKELAQGRGPNFKRVLPGSGDRKPPEKPDAPPAKTTPAKMWAAFVLSGPGD